MITLSETTEQLARVLAQRTGSTPDEVIQQALEDRAHVIGIRPVKPRRSREELIAGMKTIADRSAARPILDARSADEILGYDEHGLPT